MPVNNEIGAKIKGLRELRGVSVEDLAQRSGLPIEQINQIEAGETTTSLTPLLAIARGLGVRLGTFLDDAELSGPVITHANRLEHQGTVHFSGAGPSSSLEFHALAANKCDRNMEPFIIDVHAPTQETFELSSHEGEEFMFVLSGELEILYGKDIFHVKAGDSIYYDSIVPHHVHSARGVETRILAVIYSPH